MMASRAASRDDRALVEDLRRVVSGEVRFDAMTRVLYSTDASIYQIEPIGVVLPRTAEDVAAVVETARRHGVPVLPRGGGTSLAGQTVGHAVVIDFSKYMRDLLEVNAEEGWARVQPGIILDELNQKLAPTGMLFAPDPSTSNRGNVGGAIGNNSCGAHSIVWGKTVDNVAELTAVLSNGDFATLGPLTAGQVEERMRRDSLEGSILRSLAEIGAETRDEVAARFPQIQRRVSGYNLDELSDPAAGLDMARFVIGSEGTLLTVTDARVKIVPRPRHKALAVLHFHTLQESIEATVLTLEVDPASVELVDSMILRQARANLEYSRMMGFLEGDPEAVLLVELTGDSEAEAASKLDALERKLKRARMGYAVRRVMDEGEQARIWAVRKAGLGLMMNVPGSAKPLPFVEDTAVDPEKLPEYVRRFDEIVRSHGTTAGYYGHASVGCLHIRPLIDLKDREGVERMVAIASDVSDLVLEFGGAMSGEHGDGLVRSPWIEKMFGPKVYDAFRRVKRAFDPDGIMNPGKIVDPAPMTENLRIDPAYRAVEPDTGFSYASQGGFGGAIEMCNGQGACRKVTSGTMCPSYMVTRDEEHSTRGRANALRAAISGALPLSSLTGSRLYDVMDLCMECKGCKGECPSNVDMAKLKYEFLDRYHKANGLPVRNRLFGNIAAISRLGSFMAPVSNLVMRSTTFADLMERFANIDRRRKLPPFASQTFRQWFKARGGSIRPPGGKGQVLLFVDTFTNYNHPEIGRAATKVLERLGYEVVLPDTKCCGRPMLSAGMMDAARKNARANVDTVHSLMEGGAKLVGLEPSCILGFRDDYLDLLPNDRKVVAVAEGAMLFEEFLHSESGLATADLTYTNPPNRVLLQGHCHQKALAGTDSALSVLRSMPGCEVEEIPSGCCGMAGSFGFGREHYDISMRIGEQTLFPAVRAGNGATVVSDGVSCRQQIADGASVQAKHLAEVVAEAL